LTSSRPIPSNPRAARQPARKPKNKAKHEARVNESVQDCDRRRGLRPEPGRDETSDEGQRVQFVRDDSARLRQTMAEPLGGSAVTAQVGRGR
jgi:hypothetical protein